MSSGQWKFTPHRRGEKNVDPIQSEFFNTETLDSLADALVRESIQNSLDAKAHRQRHTQPIRVRFSLKDETDSRDPADYGPFIHGCQRHIAAEGNGLQTPPATNTKMPILIIEDFGTRGLEGDPEEDRPNSGNQHNFFYFWRNVGRSEKGESDRGRWGLGKTVFTASSQINTFFGLTKRESDGRTLLMGQTVLKMHEIDGKMFKPYGDYGIFGQEEENQLFASPVEDPVEISKFRSTFLLQRKEESGLSIVLPFPDPDLEMRKIRESINKHYFFPIIDGSLIVETEDSEGTHLLDSSTFKSVGTDHQYHNLFKFAEWCVDLREEDYCKVTLENPDRAPKWSETKIDEDELEELRSNFDANKRVAFKVPVMVQKEKNESKQAWFRVYLERDDSLPRADTHFVRDGITITGVPSIREKGIRGMVVIESGPLSMMLGDSENPAHTEWQKNSLNFKGKYKNGVSNLEFVKSSIRELVRKLLRPAEGVDTDLLKDLFSFEDQVGGEQETVTTRKKRKKRNNATKPPITPAPRPYLIDKIAGGVRIYANPNAPSPIEELSVKFAYNVRRGNAFQRYQLPDFNLGNEGTIKVFTTNAIIKTEEDNELILENLKEDFEVKVTGFDSRRDLVVRSNLTKGQTE